MSASYEHQHRKRRNVHESGNPSINGLDANEGKRAEMLGRQFAFYEQFTVSSCNFLELSKLQNPSSFMFPAQDQLTLKADEHLFSPALSSPVSLPSGGGENLTSLLFGTMKRTVTKDDTSHGAITRQLKAPVKITGNPHSLTTRNLEKHLASQFPSQQLNEDEKCLTLPVSGKNTNGHDMIILLEETKYFSIEDELHHPSACKEDIASSQFRSCHHVGIDSKGVVSMNQMPLNGLEQVQTVLGKSRVGPTESWAHEEQDKGKTCHYLWHAEALKTELAPDKDITSNLHVCIELQGKHASNEREMNTKDADFDGISCSATVPNCKQENTTTDSEINIELTKSCHDKTFTESTQDKVCSLTARESSKCSLMEWKYRNGRDSVLVNSMKCNLAENSQQNILTGDGLNNREGSHPPISTKAVLREVGQLRFWKARLALIRQQRIFSDQVFELHKLVEIQKLIAENSDIPINEIYFGVGSMMVDHHNDDSSCDSHDKGKNIIEIPDSIRLPSVVAEGNSVQQSPKSPANTVNEANKYESSSLGVVPLASVIACSADLEPGPATGGSIPISVRCDEAATVKFPFSESFADSSEQPELKDNVPSVVLQQFLLNNHHYSANTVMNLSETVTLDKKQCEQGLSSVVYIAKGNDWDAVQQQRNPPCSALISSHPKKVEQEGSP